MNLHRQINRRGEIVMGDGRALKHPGIMNETIHVARDARCRRHDRPLIRQVHLLEDDTGQFGWRLEVPDDDLMAAGQ